ncbi:hypothetical protein [Chitinophaga sp. 22536]|uniref:hypothetical protein n=1 Tax=Chitinophaga sp. 22536 TaxID=3453939 RepID=UPI003F863A9C
MILGKEALLKYSKDRQPALYLRTVGRLKHMPVADKAHIGGHVTKGVMRKPLIPGKSIHLLTICCMG